MSLPVVAIVGRPNVGKSSLFNWFAGRRISIVDPTAGVTRDRITTLIKINDRYFELVDTGGMGIVDADDLTDDVERQIQHAIDQASVIVYVVDARDGVVPLDQQVAERLRSINKPVILVANKCDSILQDDLATDFFRLGYGSPICTSAEQDRGKETLARAILKQLPPDLGDVPPPATVTMQLAIVGRRNAGKSTFINAVAGGERVIVSEVPGTTRDSVDVRFEQDGKSFIAIDTAGVRKKKSIGSDIEFYSMTRAERSIRRADVVLHFLDARLRISKVDKALVEYTLNEYKPCIFVINKWDLVKHQLPTESYVSYLRKVFPMLEYVPIVFISAISGKNVQRVLNLAAHLFKQASERVPTPELNRVIQAAVEAQGPPIRQNRTGKIRFATQVATNPPTIVLFTNGAELFDDPYRRYLLKSLRDALPYHEIPIKLYFRTRNSDNDKDGGSTEGRELALANADERPSQPKKPYKQRGQIPEIQLNEPKPLTRSQQSKQRRQQGGPRKGSSGLWSNV